MDLGTMKYDVGILYLSTVTSRRQEMIPRNMRHPREAPAWLKHDKQADCSAVVSGQLLVCRVTLFVFRPIHGGYPILMVLYGFVRCVPHLIPVGIEP